MQGGAARFLNEVPIASLKTKQREAADLAHEGGTDGIASGRHGVLEDASIGHGKASREATS
jgi:hypothetical protein